MIQTDIVAENIGEAWLQAQNHVLLFGKTVDNELIETLNYSFKLEVNEKTDPVITRYANSENIEEMRKVFHTTISNKFGHSYLEKMTGPTDGNPIKSVVKALRGNPTTKRAVITLNGSLKGDVPCLNVMQFIGRGRTMHVNYFARGQDIYNKFYADTICVSDIAKKIRSELNFNNIVLSGTIGSAHIYINDVVKSKALLDDFNSTLLDSDIIKSYS